MRTGQHVPARPAQGPLSPRTGHSGLPGGHLCLHPDGEVVGVARMAWAQQGLWLTCDKQDLCFHTDTERQDHTILRSP